ncbi:hypothetical protein IAT38_007378 [Cryptococcus sp. DSM 104549]
MGDSNEIRTSRDSKSMIEGNHEDKDTVGGMPRRSSASGKIIARQAVWGDLPDWGGRTDCPLMGLPVELLDLCFGTELDTGLQIRDYLALAGTSWFFRYRLDYDFFDYTPTAARSKWTREEYEYYRAGKAFVKRQSAVMQAQAQITRRQWREGKKKCLIVLGGSYRTLIQVIPDLADGESPDNAQPCASTSSAAAADDPARHLSPPFDRIGEEHDLFDRRARADRSRLVALYGSPELDEEWVVPDSDSDSDHGDLVDVKYDVQSGDLIPHDFYPNSYRCAAAKWLHGQIITQSDAVKEFQVSEAELLCLNHRVVSIPQTDLISSEDIPS